jgi:hypothetical protein
LHELALSVVAVIDDRGARPRDRLCELTDEAGAARPAWVDEAEMAGHVFDFGDVGAWLPIMAVERDWRSCPKAERDEEEEEEDGGAAKWSWKSHASSSDDSEAVGEEAEWEW